MRVDRRWANYGKAAAVTALAVLLRWGLDRLFGQLPTFITFYPAVVVSAALWGAGPGLLATALSMAAADFWFIQPIGSLLVSKTADAVGLGVFGSVGAALSVLLGRVRAAVIAQTRRAEAAAAELGQVAEQRRLALEVLRESEERFRLLFHQAAVGIKRLDLQGRILEVNDKFCEILGYSREELLPLTLKDYTHPEDLPRERAEITRLLSREISSYSVEKRCLRKDGGLIWVRVTSSLPSGSDRPIEWWISVVEDITHDKQAEEALKRTADELARSNEDLEQFAYVASHDLQEPLRMVAGYLQLLSERYRGQIDAKADKYIAYAVDGAERMSILIRDLLAYSRVSTRAEPLSSTSSQEALDFALKNLHSAIGESGAAVTFDRLPVVRADKTQLTQVFQNVVGNALKFRDPERPPQIRVAVREDQGQWLFSVSDNGIGFEQQYEEKMFVIFQRLHGRGHYPGTGIGLAICRRIVERHGGRIWARGEPGKGSTFFFTLPS
jgi:PAS domain S-box-containing protein